jgi:hypothetical protein
MARKNEGECANPKHIRTDVDCRAARPKFDEGAWSPAKISDVTGRGLYLFVTPDESRPGNAASKLWRMSYSRWNCCKILFTVCLDAPTILASSDSDRLLDRSPATRVSQTGMAGGPGVRAGGERDVLKRVSFMGSIIS